MSTLRRHFWPGAGVSLALVVGVALCWCVSSAGAADPATSASDPAAVAQSSIASPLSGAGEGTASGLELRGVLRISERWKFRICDPATDVSAWLAIGEPCEDFVIRAYDATDESVLVERRGAVSRLTMNKSSLVAGLLAQVHLREASPPVDIAAESRRFGIERPRFGPGH
jgi:hypothetical protein